MYEYSGFKSFGHQPMLTPNITDIRLAKLLTSVFSISVSMTHGTSRATMAIYCH